MKITKKQRIASCIALAVTLYMLAVAVASPILFQEKEPESTQDVTLAGLDDLFNKWKGDNGKIDWSFFAVDVLVHINPLSAIGWETHKYYYGEGQVPPPNTSAGDEGELAKQMRLHEAEIVFTVLNSNKELLANSISGYSDIWKFSNAYWMRQSEIAATEYWVLKEAYNSTHIFERSGLAENLSKLFANVEEGTDVTFALLNDRLSTWSSESNYSQMSITITYGDQTMTGSNMDIKIRNGIIPTANANMAYLDGRELWASGSASIYAEDGTKYDLSQGYNDLQSMGIKSGTYAFQVGREYAGSIVPTVSANACKVQPVAVLTTNSDCKLAFYNGSHVSIGNTNYASLGIKVDTGDGNTSEIVDLLPILQEKGTMISTTEQTLSKSHASAQAIWQVFNVTQEANILLSPSSLVPDNSVEVSADEMYMLTVSYLQQVHDMYERTNGNIQQTGFLISADSLDLLIRGDIYDENGTAIYTDVVFTPYIWLNALSLNIGRVTLDQIGNVAIWGESQDLNGWTKGDKIPSMVAVAPNYSFDIKQIMKNQSLVDHYDVTIKEVQKWHEITVTPGPTPVPVPYLIDAVPLVAMILGLIALCFVELWFILDCEYLWILLIAGIFALLAIFGARWVTGML
ncbi:hypothetical protein [Candidatus Methanomassiliicoccus intestinalis]|jgi:hypothetical protein|uniref:hypothetical protein n=1 Tax=Candidatus Methanomassiliicoccus intestinalis TaxID=1406512 RepID=UPI0037DC1C82